MSPWIAAHAASFIGAGIGKSGIPCARFIAPYWFEMRVISRITDSVNVLARFAVAARRETFLLVVIISWKVPDYELDGLFILTSITPLLPPRIPNLAPASVTS